MKKIVAFMFVLIATLTTLIFPCYAEDYNIPWTEDEIAFINEHPVIRLGVDPEFVPFEFINDNGEYEGITPDYLALIHERTGLEFEVVKGLTWSETYEWALAREIDVLPSVGKTEEREKHFLFSQPYYYFKRVIVTRDSDTNISSIEDMEGFHVAVQRDSSNHSYLLSYPKVNLSIYDSVEAALTEVATGTEKVFVGNLTQTNYIIRSSGLTNLRLVSFEAEKQQALHFAVRKDWPELVSILDKAIDTITQSEKLAINNKWINLTGSADNVKVIRFFVMMSILVFFGMGVSFFWIARLRKEVSQRKHIQEDLEKSKKAAEESNFFKSSFMARMSHEIRTPLNAIIGMAYLLKKTKLSLTQGMYAEQILQASSNMLSIIDDILDYSKIEAGKMDLEVAAFSMDQVIQNVVNIMSYKVEEQEIVFNLTKDPIVPNWFLGDSKRIQQILINILNNAVKFTDEGEVSMDIRLIEKKDENCHVSFTIKDTGIGINEEQIKKLFIPFTQGDVSITRRFGGSGLGLSIVKSLLDLMDGDIEVFSTAGKGSTFIINLWLSADKEKEEEYRRSFVEDHIENIRTLVLEKTEEGGELIKSYLSAFGTQCLVTTSPTSAINMLILADGAFTKPFDLFIVDYEALAEEGLEFVKAIENDQRIVKKPRIFMLLPMMREDLFDKLKEYGIDMGIGKPIIPSILYNSILEAFVLKKMHDLQSGEQEKTDFISLDREYCVLVAEDNNINQLIAKSLLQKVGIESILASDGKAAVELYNQYKDEISLILMDLHMPDMNGYEAAEAIRKVSSDIPIIAVTADVIAGVREKCVQSGMYHYISKPFNPDRFLKTVTDVLLENENRNLSEPGELDIASGLRNMDGNAELYHQVLSLYYKENKKILEELSRTIDERRYGDSVQIIHKVKSSAGSIGAKAAYELAIRLQKVLDEKKENEISVLQKEFIYKFALLLDEISAFLGKGNG